MAKANKKITDDSYLNEYIRKAAELGKDIKHDPLVCGIELHSDCARCQAVNSKDKEYVKTSKIGFEKSRTT